MICPTCDRFTACETTPLEAGDPVHSNVKLGSAAEDISGHVAALFCLVSGYPYVPGCLRSLASETRLAFQNAFVVVSGFCSNRCGGAFPRRHLDTPRCRCHHIPPPPPFLRGLVVGSEVTNEPYSTRHHGAHRYGPQLIDILRCQSVHH